MKLRYKIAIIFGTLLALALVGESLGVGAKKGTDMAAGRITLHHEFIVTDGSVTAPQFTTNCDQGLSAGLANNSGSGQRARCYVPAGEQWEITRFSITATDALGVTEECTVCVYFDGVCKTWTEIHIGSASTSANTTCEALVSVGGDGRIDTNDDSCTQVNTDADSNTILDGVFGGGRTYYLIGFADSNDCSGVESVHVEIDGFIETI